MASSFLHQALFILPKSPVQSASTNLDFSASLLPRRPISVGLVSRVPTRHFALNFTEKVRNRSLPVRAEPEDIEVNAEVVETEEVAVVLSDEKPPRQPRTKLGDIMGILNKRAVEASDKERPIPDLRTGDIVEVKLEVPENKRRLSVYKGIIISRQNAGIHTTIRIRRIIAGVGVEIVFPIYSPNIKEIKVVKHRKVRRARLYYLRDKLPRLSTFK